MHPAFYSAALAVGVGVAAVVPLPARAQLPPAPTPIPQSRGPYSTTGATAAATAALRVGPGREYRSLGEAAAIARPGQVIEVEAGEYPGDVAVIDKDNVVVRGVNGRARFTSNNRVAEGKGLLIVRASGVVVENLELNGARVSDGNGSGIRLEAGSLVVRNSKFAGNQNAILTSNDTAVQLEVENCEFEGDNSGDRLVTHVLYAGSIDRLIVRGSYFHRGKVGHLIKTRARETLIAYNRITDEDGTASYEVEMPDGGAATLIGNLIQQSPNSENSTIVSFGAESYRWPQNELTLAHNTIVNDRREGGTFVAVRKGSGPVHVRNNLLVGPGGFEIRAAADVTGNVFPARSDFAAPDTFDFRIRLASKLAGSAADPGTVGKMRLRPTRQYAHPASSVALPRATALTPLNPGAFQHLAP